MKKKTTKKVVKKSVIKLNGVKTMMVTFPELDEIKQEVQVDTDIFEDFYTEACTRAVEINIKNKQSAITPFVEVRLKSDDKFKVFNVYKILINASYHIHAQVLRDNFKKACDIDLNDEPLCAKLR